MICHCDACKYTFDASVLHCKYEVPTRCPDCGKKTVGYKVPAVRATNEAEVAYRKPENCDGRTVWDAVWGVWMIEITVGLTEK